MLRELEEVLASQKKMLGRLGKEDDNIPDEKMKKIYQGHLQQVKEWISKQPNIEVLYVNYNSMLNDPIEPLHKVNECLGGGMNVEMMAKIVDKSLYRERK